MKKKVLSVLLAITVFATLLVGCESGSSSDDSQDAGSDEAAAEETEEAEEVEIVNPGDPISLGSMVDDEGRILGTILVKYLESKGYEVDNQAGTVANAASVRPTILEHQLDLVVEYTGRGLMFIDGVDPSLYQKDYETAFQTSKEGDAPNGIDWISYAPYNNTDAIVVSKDFAEENNITSIKDLADYYNNGGDGAFGVPHDYILSSEAGFIGWKKAYGLDIPEDLLLVGITNTETALRDGTDGLVAAHLFSTNALIKEYDFQILDDPDHVAPIYSGAVIGSFEITEKYPELKELFDEVLGVIDDEVIVDLNSQLLSEGRSEEDIANDFLTEHGFI